MKNILLLLFLLSGSFSPAFAQQEEQDPARREQQIQALYVAYITQQLNLNEEEAQKFWPLHRQFDGELRSVDINMAELPRQQAILDIKKRYQERFIKILGNNSRVDNFFRKDTEFRKKLVDTIRKRRQQNNMNQRPYRRNN